MMTILVRRWRKLEDPEKHNSRDLMPRNRFQHFISFRREYIDTYLENVPFTGRVIDIGGKKESKRGRFRPPRQSIQSWEYSNIDPTTNPDFLCPAEKMPIEDHCFDWVVCAEVLEHLAYPYRALDEMIRVLKPGGRLVLLAPFIYSFHGDPDDYQRWTKTKLLMELEEKRGLLIEDFQSMGGVWAVVWDLFYSISSPGGPTPWKKRTRKWLKRSLPIVYRLEAKQIGKEKATTGYGVIARRRK